MVRRCALERCETGTTPLETRGKRKPVTPEDDSRETGLSFLNGGAGENREIFYFSYLSNCLDNGYPCFYPWVKHGPISIELGSKMLILG